MSQPDLADDLEQAGFEDEQPVAQQPQPQPRRKEVPAQKQKTNIYTVMQVISCVCIIVACILLYWELTLWGSYPWWSTSS